MPKARLRSEAPPGLQTERTADAGGLKPVAWLPLLWRGGEEARRAGRVSWDGGSKDFFRRRLSARRQAAERPDVRRRRRSVWQRKGANDLNGADREPTRSRLGAGRERRQYFFRAPAFGRRGWLAWRLGAADEARPSAAQDDVESRDGCLGSGGPSAGRRPSRAGRPNLRRGFRPPRALTKSDARRAGRGGSAARRRRTSIFFRKVFHAWGKNMI
jgi:hypothetical protein